MKIIPYPSPNFDLRFNPIDTIIIHYTDMLTAKEALDRLRDPEAIVSAHYLIAENGDIYQLVSDDKRARHAGISHWQGVDSLNNTSIGIELANPGHTNGYTPFPKEQMRSLVELCHLLMKKHKISYVLGHSDVAPTRKMDPGELFDWQFLAFEGIGVWPQEEDFIDEGEPSEDQTIYLLKKIGYGFDPHNPDEFKAALLAFQRHFVQDNLTGVWDKKTWAMLNAVAHTLDNLE